MGRKSNSLMNIFKYSAVSGAGTFIGLLPQMIIGLIVFAIGYAIQKKYSKLLGLPLILLGALMMFQTGVAMSAVKNVINSV